LFPQTQSNNFFLFLKEAAKEMRLAVPKAGTAAYNVIIDAYGKGKLIDRMESAFEAMQETGHQPDVITYWCKFLP
jgi:pentatricopeptide repeat protein